MVPLIAVAAFVVVPWVLGFRSGRYWTAVLPGAVCIAIVAMHTLSPPERTGDEVDVQAPAYLVFSIVGVVVCLAGAALRRRWSKPL